MSLYWFNLFTYWIYISFILYYFKLIPFNPLPFYILIVIRDILFLILNSSKKTNIDAVIFLKIFLIISVHYIPIYYLYNSSKNNKNKNNNNNNKKNKNKNIKLMNESLTFYIILFVIYFIYIHSNNLNLLYILNDVEHIYSNIFEYIETRFNSVFEFSIWIIIILYMNYKILNKKY